MTVELRNHLGALIDGGVAGYYAGAALGWINLGATTGGQVSTELLAGNYPFAITYAYQRAQKTQNIGTNPVVTFQTGQVFSASGTCSHYYADGWRAFTQGIEMLPGDILFRFTTGTPNQDTCNIKAGRRNAIR